MAGPAILDDTLISGQRAFARMIGPEIVAVPVDVTDLSQCAATVEACSEIWGSGSYVYVPLVEGTTAAADPWPIALTSGRLDGYSRTALLDPEIGTRFHGLGQGPSGFTERIWSILATEVNPATSAPLNSELPTPDDPWYVSYLAALGCMRDRPTEGGALRAGVVPDLRIDDLMPVERGVIEQPDGQDLLRRLRDRTVWTPRRLSLYDLSVSVEPWSQDLVVGAQWTSAGWTRAFVGSNIVVVYEPSSVADFCLLWMLRAAHGLNHGLPLGVPATTDVPAELARWMNIDRALPHTAVRHRGFGRPFAITSLSVDADRLEAIASAAGAPWEVIAVSDLIQAPHRPCVRSAGVTSFSNGEALIEAWDPASRALLEERSPAAHGLSVRLRVVLSDRPLPPLMTLRGGDRIGLPNWRDGGFDVEAPDIGKTVEVQWPPGFSVLRAAVLGHGLDIRPSGPGRAAHALLKRMGSLAETDPLKHPWLLGQLDGLAERVGMSWFKSRMRRLTAEADAAEESERLERIESLLEQIGQETGSEHQHELVFGPLSGRFGHEAARRWLGWAEDRGLLIRGVNVDCTACSHTSWNTTGELGSPVVCRGCGEPIHHPFRPDLINFSYRASQLLLNAMASDALPHLLCASWWSALFRGGYLYGVHLGAEFLEAETVIGEADIVLLLDDGRLALGECKRSGAGLRTGDIDKLEAIADRIGAAWTFYATPDWAANCPPIWQDLRRDLPDRRRFALTGEQLLTPSDSLVQLMGQDLTAFNPWDDAAIDTHAEAFKSNLVPMLDHLERPPGLHDWILLAPDGQD